MSGSTYVCRCYDFVVEAVLMGVLCLVGFVGNTMSVICLRVDRSKTATPLLLIALELADTAFLATVFLLRVLTSLHTFLLDMRWSGAIVPVFGKYVYPTALFAHTLSIYLTILVTVQRYACLCRPYHASLCCQRKHVRRYVVSVVIFAAVFTLPRFFEYDIVQSAVLATAADNSSTSAEPTTTDHVLLTSWKVAQTDFSRNRVYKIVYFNLNHRLPIIRQCKWPLFVVNCCELVTRVVKVGSLFQPAVRCGNVCRTADVVGRPESSDDVGPTCGPTDPGCNDEPAVEAGSGQLPP